jgi:phage terminase large subunit-like protein
MADRTPPPAWAVRTAADRKALADGCYWDQAAADRPIRFAENYLAPKYTTAGEFELFEWERRFLMCVYGWRNPDGTRRFRRAVLHVAKKNGKTLLVAIIAAYELFAAEVASPLVGSGSTSRQNAKQVYEHLRACVRRNAKLSAAAKLVDYQKVIKVPARDAEYRALSADAPTAEGENFSCSIIDEAHAHKNPRLYRALEYSMIGRPDGVQVVISTAGDDLTHWYYSLLQRARRVLAGEDLDPTLYAEVYEADGDKDDLDDPATWKKANPSLDLYPGFTSARFAADLAAAKGSVGDWLSFKRYRLNIFCRSEDEAWIDIPQWDRLKAPADDAELLGLPCFLALDASQTTDPTSLVAVWLRPGKRFYARAWAWVAEAGVRKREASNLPKYTQFAADGSMTITPGDVIDKELVKRKILSFRDAGHRVQMLVIDPNGLWVLGTELAGEGVTVYRMTQSFKEFSEPCKELPGLVAAGAIEHDGNGWLRYCLHSTRLAVEENRQRPHRDKSVDKIDGAVSLLMALKPAMQASADVKPKATAYDNGPVDLFL